ncbi:ABC transporter substrate-binding protein [Bradyrhizobium prioriisuperbiae]|uniref:ABC transporter substrate-binding protein n=1 Tax=Bradyrhizobium prioriisuperbiae TaxID=2854389 RepID=UPI0028E7E6B5|nr:extracellular solute-binding protein [Bradyrhizobium prioritasuperba]
MRTALKLWLAIACVTTVVLDARPGLTAEREIAVQAWGTAWEQGLQQIATNFEKKTGIHVVPVTQSGSADGFARLQSMRDAPKIDVWFTTSSFAARVTTDQKMFSKIPEQQFTNLGSLVAGGKSDTWVGAYYYPLSVIYRPKLVKAPINAWTDIWKPEFKGALSVPDVQTYQARMLLLSALTHGGSIDNVEPGFAALKELKPNIAMFYGSDSDVRRALAQGEITAMVGPPSQAKPLRDDNVDVVVKTPKPAVILFDVMALVNTPKKDMAVQFMDFVISSESQKIISTMFDMGPVNHMVVPSAQLAAALPSEADQVTFDEAKINANVAAWNERFKAEIAR